MMILIVDDDADVRKAAMHLIKNQGLTLYECENGQEALDAFQTFAGKLKAVLMDVNMPVMNGIETQREMMLIRQDIPIILMSGEPQSVDGPFLRKPFNQSQLLALLPIP